MESECSVCLLSSARTTNVLAETEVDGSLAHGGRHAARVACGWHRKSGFADWLAAYRPTRAPCLVQEWTIWDLGGQGRYRGLWERYLRSGVACTSVHCVLLGVSVIAVSCSPV
jgi:hypothetical protein